MGLPAPTQANSLVWSRYTQETNENRTDILDRAWDYFQSIRKGYKLRVFKSGKPPVLSRLYCNHHADCAEGELFAEESFLVMWY